MNQIERKTDFFTPFRLSTLCFSDSLLPFKVHKSSSCCLRLTHKEKRSRVEEMHSQAEASSFPERVEAEASDVHLSVEHAHCLSFTRKKRLPLAWAAFINTLAICCGQRF